MTGGPGGLPSLPGAAAKTGRKIMNIVYATYSTQVETPDGGRHMVRGGQHWPAADPVVAAAPAGLFSPDARYGLTYTSVPPEMAEATVEQATAAPGERRSGTRRG